MTTLHPRNALPPPRMIERNRGDLEPQRAVYKLGRWGVTRTEKRAGDHFWNSRTQKFEVVR